MGFHFPFGWLRLASVGVNFPFIFFRLASVGFLIHFLAVSCGWLSFSFSGEISPLSFSRWDVGLAGIWGHIGI